MDYTDEMLMAFADGEMDQASCAAIEQAMREDPTLARKVAVHKALRSTVHGAFLPILDEALPARLVQPKQQAGPQAGRSGTVVQLDAVRARKAARQPGARRAAPDWSWPQWGALAATLIVGVVLGRFGFTGPEPKDQMASISTGKDGALIAQGTLALALEQQLASAAPVGGKVKIGVSFVSREGGYCRSFTTSGQINLAGLACAHGAEWTIPVLAQAAPSAPNAYRTAATEMPSAVLDAIDQRIVGASLDAKAEQRALLKKWQR